MHPLLATGGVKSPHDYRDVPLSAVTPAKDSPIPGTNILDVSQLPIWMQNLIGACTGHAGGKYLQKRLLTATGKLVPISARFAYAWAKAQDPQNVPRVEGWANGGTYPRLIGSCFKNVGAATEATVPNNTLLDALPYVYSGELADFPASAMDDAALFKIPGYAFPNVAQLSQIQQAVDEFEGCMLLVQVGKEWYTGKNGVSSWAPVDILPVRPPAVIISGHEIYVYGYEAAMNGTKADTKIHFINSWSDQWGNGGKGWLWWSEYQEFIVEAITFVELPASIAAALAQLPTAANFSYHWSATLAPGSKGPDVVALQTALMIDGEFGEGLYSTLLTENELGTFGAATTAAVEAFQRRYGLSATGVASVGPATRGKLNALFSR